MGPLPVSRPLTRHSKRRAFATVSSVATGTRSKQTLRRLPSFAATRTRGRCCAAASLSNQGYQSFLPRRKGLSGSAKLFFPGHARVDATLTAKAARRKSPFNSISFSEHARAATGSAQHVSRQGAPPRRGTPVVVLAGEKNTRAKVPVHPLSPIPSLNPKKKRAMLCPTQLRSQKSKTSHR